MDPSLEQLVRDASTGGRGAREVRAAARLMTLLESEPQRLPELFQASPLHDWPQPRVVLGITGAPGSGKSTLTDQLIAEHRRRYPDRRIGVIAVDPSSPFTGGAVLGDRVRMMRHATDPNVFVRSLASRGHLGGLSLGVKGVLRIMGLIGCDMVFIETVGVGQSEVEVAGVADMVMIVLAPGQGDSIQMLKAGLMEIGDIFVINKADKDGALQLHSTLLGALSFDAMPTSHEEHESLDLLGGAPQPELDPELEDAMMARRRPDKPEVFLVSAVEQTGVTELVDGIETRASRLQTHWHHRREASAIADVRDSVFEEVRRRTVHALQQSGSEENQLREVLNGALSVEELADRLLRTTVQGG